MIDVIIRDVNGNSLGLFEVDVDVPIDHAEAHITDSGNIVVTVTLREEL